MTNFVQIFLDNLEKQAELREQFKQDSNDYLVLVRQIVKLAGGMPEAQRRNVQGQLQDWKQAYLTAQKQPQKLEDAVPQMSTLCGQLRRWLQDNEPQPGSQQPPTSQTTPPTTGTSVPQDDSDSDSDPEPLDLVALQNLLDQLKFMTDEVKLAQLPLPPLVTQPIDRGAAQVKLGDKAIDVEGAHQALQMLIGEAQSLIDFSHDWVQLRGRETRAEAPPHAPLLFTEVDNAWQQGKQDLQQHWSQVSTAGELKGCVSKLNNLDRQLLQSREDLMKQHDRLLDRLQQHEQRLTELRSTRLLNLTPPTMALLRARSALQKADSQQKLDVVWELLKPVDQQLEQAAQGLVGKNGEALEAFEKAMLKVQALIGQAGKFRGAETENSPVFQAIKELEDTCDRAERLRLQARTTEQLIAARQPLQELLDSTALKDIEALSKQEKKNAEKDLKALPEYQKLLEELRRVRSPIAELPGASEELRKLDTLLAQVSVGPGGTPPGGFAAAVETLKKNTPESMMEAAKKASIYFTTRKLSVQELADTSEATRALKDCEPHFTPFEISLRRQELARAQEIEDPAQRSQALLAFAKTLTQALQDQKDYEAAERKFAAEIETDLKAALRLGVLAGDPAVATIRQRLEEASGMLQAWRLVDAHDSLLVLRELTTDLLAAADTASKNWQRDLKLLNDNEAQMKLYAGTWGEVGVGAQGQLNSLAQITHDFEGRRLDIREAAERAAMMLKSAERIQEKAKQQGMDTPGSMDGVSSLLNQMDRQWDERWQQIKLRLDVYDKALVKGGVKGGIQSLPWHETLQALRRRWDDAKAGFTMKPGTPATEQLKALYRPLLEELLQLQATIGAPKDPGSTKDPKVAVAIRLGKAVEEKAEWQQTHERALGLLHEIRADMKYQADIDIPSKLKLTFDHIAVGKSLGETFVPGSASAEKAKEWRKSADAMEKWLVERRKEIRKEKEPMRSSAQELKKAVGKKLLDRQSVKFSGLFDDIAKRLDDALNMLETDDVALIKAAEQQITEIRLMVKDAKGKGGKESVSLDMVEKRHAKYSHLLGDGYDVQKRMPQTYARLKAQLDKTWLEVKRLPPEEGMQRLKELKAPILNASKSAPLLTKRYEAFKALRKEVEDLHAKLKDHTGTTLAKGRTKAFNEKLKSRIEEAHGLARQEGRLDDGFKELEVLRSELQDLLNQPKHESRANVLLMDAELADEQRELRDLARTWNATQAFWEEKRLPRVKEAMEKRKEKLGEYNSLLAAVQNIGRTLVPYLETVSAVPHKRYRSNGAPDMATARGAFSQAHLRLSQLQRVAERLEAGNSSTNVNLVKDLSKLRDEWLQRTGKLTHEMTQLAIELRKLPGLADTDKAALEDEKRKANYLTPEDKSTLEQSVVAIEKGLQTLSTRFPAEAFDPPFNKLGDQQLDGNARRQAREEALRIVNRLKADVVDNPLFQGLFAGAREGALTRDPRPAIGLLRATLKKIELAVLVGA